MAFRLGSTTGNNVRARASDAVVQAIDQGSTNTTGRIKIYTGSQPSDPGQAVTGTLLVTINFANPSFGSSDATGTAGLAGGTAIAGTVASTGTAGWFRVFDRNDRAMFDGSIGLSGSGADIIFDSTSFVATGTATISSLTYQTPM